MSIDARARFSRLAAVAQPRMGGAWAAARGWYAARSIREQRMIAVLGAVAAAVLLVVAVVRPLQAGRARARADIHTYETLDAQLRAAGPAGLASQPQRPRGDPATVIPEAAQDFGLTIQRIEPEGGRIRVTLANAPFQAVLGFLAQLDAANAIPVAEIRIDRQTDPGQVDAQILLGR